MALPLAQTLRPRGVVFDVMDELSAFAGAPQEMKDLEAATLAWADVVFTGGPSLYRAKLGRHENLHCFPSSVDAAHFGQARSIDEAPDQAHLPHPRLGFYGVIDERMDLGLLDFLATSHPDWQIVMVGPVVKIDWAWLPKQPNLHFLGQRQYAELPSYLAGWDVCLLPFALNESTKFISPTKTLEYMAAELPIVSTPITDVAEPYGRIVYLGNTHDEFVAACEQALAATSEELERRVQQMRQVLATTSWDNTAAAMERLIDEAVARNSPKSAPSGDEESVGDGLSTSISRST
jgi:UDP-galactopyranose mutase